MAKIIKNTKQLETAMDKIMRKALDGAAEDVELLISQFISLWYGDYLPIKYKRTYQFLHSCVRAKVIRHGSQYKTRVYIDYKNMHHIMDNVNGRNNVPLTQSQEYAIVHEANRAIHGIKDRKPGAEGIKFWDDAMDDMQQNDYIINSFYHYLKDMGFTATYVPDGGVMF